MQELRQIYSRDKFPLMFLRPEVAEKMWFCSEKVPAAVKARHLFGKTGEIKLQETPVIQWISILYFFVCRLRSHPYTRWAQTAVDGSETSTTKTRFQLTLAQFDINWTGLMYLEHDSAECNVTPETCNISHKSESNEVSSVWNFWKKDVRSLLEHKTKVYRMKPEERRSLVDWRRYRRARFSCYRLPRAGWLFRARQVQVSSTQQLPDNGIWAKGTTYRYEKVLPDLECMNIWMTMQWYFIE